MKNGKIKIFSLFSVISITIFSLVLVIYLIASSSYKNADFINEGISHSYRSQLADITGIFNFSIFEILIISLPVIIGVLIFSR